MLLAMERCANFRNKNAMTAVTAVLTEIPSALFNRLVRMSLQTGQDIDAYVIEALEVHVATLEDRYLSDQQQCQPSMRRRPAYTLDDMERDLGRVAEILTPDHSECRQEKPQK